MRPWRQGSVRQRLEDTDTRLHQAQEALGESERKLEEVDQQVGFLQGLKVRWDKVHQTNHLAEIFAKDGGLG